MASFLSETPEDFQGVPKIFEFTNNDGELFRTNCGQAASATFLTHHGVFPPDEGKSAQIMNWLEKTHPPDNFGGMFGTSRARVERICRSLGLALTEVEGEVALREHLANGNPVLVMLAVPAGSFLGFTLPGGHWMVAYGYDEQNVYLTNYGTMAWEEFRDGWRGMVPNLIRMSYRGLVATEDNASA